MTCYDYHVRIDEVQDIDKTIDVLKKLGFSGAGFIVSEKNKNSVPKIPKSKTFDMVVGIELVPKKASQIDGLAQKYRSEFDLIIVKGGSVEVNRAAVECPYVDILSTPWGNRDNLRQDSGINHVIAKIAKQNGVYIEFNFNQLLHTHKKNRQFAFSSFLQAAKTIKKQNAPFVLTSKAFSRWDIRSMSELTSLGRILGFQDTAIKKALSGKMLKEIRKRKTEKWVMPGVEKV